MLVWDYLFEYTLIQFKPKWTLWGQMGPNCQVESICGHIFVRHFHILIIFDHMIANGDTKKWINPNDLDWPWNGIRKHFFLSISLFQSHFHFRKDMSNFRNPRWPPRVAILDFWGQRSSQISKIGHKFAMKTDIGVIFFSNDIFSLSLTW